MIEKSKQTYKNNNKHNYEATGISIFASVHQ